jgi:hypothetical protein
MGAVVAYAATRPSGEHRGLVEHHAVKQPTGSPGNGPGGNGAPPRRERLLTPQLIETPPATTAVSDPQFRFNVPPRTPGTPSSTAKPSQPGQAPTESTRRFQCRVDGENWDGCQSPYRLNGLAPGSHRIVVRVFNREERAGEPVDFEWQQTAAAAGAPPASAKPVARPEPGPPEQFSIVALQNPEDLYPGLAPTPIPIRVGNPNDVAIEVTEIAAAVGEAPADCAAENFELIPAAVSPEAPLTVPAEGSVDLPVAGPEAPAIQMLDLPVEQDACRGAEIPLVFSGQAHG